MEHQEAHQKYNLFRRRASEYCRLARENLGEGDVLDQLERNLKDISRREFLERYVALSSREQVELWKILGFDPECEIRDQRDRIAAAL